MKYFVIDSNASSDVSLISQLASTGYKAILFDFMQREVKGQSVKAGSKRKLEASGFGKYKSNVHFYNALQSNTDGNLILTKESPEFEVMWQTCIDGLKKEVVEKFFKMYLKDFTTAQSGRRENTATQSRYNISQCVIADISSWLRDEIQLDVQNNDQMADLIFSNETEKVYEKFCLKFLTNLRVDESKKYFYVAGRKVHNSLDINDMKLIMLAYQYQCPLLTRNISMFEQTYGSFATYILSRQVLFLDATESHSDIKDILESKMDHDYRCDCDIAALKIPPEDLAFSPEREPQRRFSNSEQKFKRDRKNLPILSSDTKKKREGASFSYVGMTRDEFDENQVDYIVNNLGLLSGSSPSTKLLQDDHIVHDKENYSFLRNIR